MADAPGKTQLGSDQNPTRTRKLFSSFLFKAVMAVLVLVLFPVVTSHPPEFIVGQATPSAPTRSWEILHILFVGIAVSYGLFSKRNAAADGAEDGEKNGSNVNAGKFENAQSYVNRFLQLSSSLFDDDSDGGGISPSGSDVGRIQSMAWNSQYFRNEPMLVVDEDQSVGDSLARISDKPLLLPVRSLHSRVLDDPRDDSGEFGLSPASLSRSGSMTLRSRDSSESSVSAAFFSRSSSTPGLISRRVSNGGSNIWDEMDESGVPTAAFSRRSSNSKRVPNGSSGRSRNGGRVSDTGYPELGNDEKGSVVLPSPIPWKSRSERMDVREDVDSVDSFKIDDLGESQPEVSWSPSTAFSTPSSPSPRRLSPSSSLSSVSPEAKIVTDSFKKKTSYKPRIPVPPPPPLPPSAATYRLPTEKQRPVTPNNGIPREMAFGNDSLFEYRSHPKSVRTTRSSAETVRRNVSGKDLEENFFDGVLRNEERRQDFYKKMIIESEGEQTENSNDDSDSDDDVVEDEERVIPKGSGTLPSYEKVAVTNGAGGDGGPDVDKKADEFIAKFREQIRLQRIESIKRSSTEISKNSAR